MKYYLLALTAALFSILKLAAQTDPNWDNTDLIQWSHGFLKVEISSSLDGNKQEAYLYASHSSRTKPLIVSLHTWSGDFKQKDPIANEILARDWNYIHPDFRGSNDKPDAACSKFVLSDIEDAIRYAIKNTNADPEDVHIIGVSGGAMVTLAAYMNIQYPVKSFSAWVPISNLEAWYWESVGRKQKYAADILKIVSVDSIFNAEEARLRSPLFQKFPRELRKNAELYLYAGIHDGYEGSVPITHSINMYNRLIGELRYNTNNMNQIMQEANMDSNLVSREDIISLLTRQFNPEYKHNESLFDRNVYLSRRYENVELTIFEGGHEQIPQALSLIPHKDTTSLKFNILTIGDSNGNNKGGWVDQLRKMMPESKIINNSQAGRTIGFDNNGQEKLNALRNIDSYLTQAADELKDKSFDYIIVCLGTNDTKDIFKDRQEEVIKNLSQLLDKIKHHPLIKPQTKLVFISPPPIREANILEKYQGGNERLKNLVPQFKLIAETHGFEFIDVYIH